MDSVSDFWLYTHMLWTLVKDVMDKRTDCKMKARYLLFTIMQMSKLIVR